MFFGKKNRLAPELLNFPIKFHSPNFVETKSVISFVYIDCDYCFNMIPTSSTYEPADQDVQIIRNWLRKMPHVVQDYDDDFIKGFIRGCKGRLEKTKKRLENFNAVHCNYPEFYGHLDIFDKKIQDYLSESRIILLPKTLKDGSSVIIASLDHQIGNHDPYKVHLSEMFRYLHMIFYIAVWERINKDKLVLVIDWRQLSALDIREVTPMFIKAAVEALETAMPFRLQAIHNIYVPPVLEYVLNLIKSFAKKKISNRIFFHSKADTIFDSVPRNILPKDYGGDEPDVNTLHATWLKKVESYRDRLVKEHMKMKALDKIRPRVSETVGTFKSLNVD